MAFGRCCLCTLLLLRTQRRWAATCECDPSALHSRCHPTEKSFARRDLFYSKQKNGLLKGTVNLVKTNSEKEQQGESMHTKRDRERGRGGGKCHCGISRQLVMVTVTLIGSLRVVVVPLGDIRVLSSVYVSLSLDNKYKDKYKYMPRNH